MNVSDDATNKCGDCKGDKVREVLSSLPDSSGVGSKMERKLDRLLLWVVVLFVVFV